MLGSTIWCPVVTTPHCQKITWYCHNRNSLESLSRSANWTGQSTLIQIPNVKASAHSWHAKSLFFSAGDKNPQNTIYSTRAGRGTKGSVNNTYCHRCDLPALLNAKSPEDRIPLNLRAQRLKTLLVILLGKLRLFSFTGRSKFQLKDNMSAALKHTGVPRDPCQWQTSNTQSLTHIHLDRNTCQTCSA